MIDTPKILDPLEFAKLCWPHVTFYKQQKEIIYSVRDNDETFAVAGNMLGKDFVAAFIVLWYFVSRQPCRILTTSVKDTHLDILWGEIGWFIRESKYPLEAKHGGLLIINHHHIRKMYKGERCPLSKVIGQVASDITAESMQGYHIKQTGDGIPRTMFVADEASSLPDSYYTMADTWANRKFVFGNPWECQNFFKHAVKGRPGTRDKGGDIRAPNNEHFWRKVIKITADDSPNVRYGKAQVKLGKKPEILIPGVKPYEEYMRNRDRWDEVRQCICLDAEFWEGPDELMFPPIWLNGAEKLAKGLTRPRRGEAMGVDPAEGSDRTAWAITDFRGLIHLESKKTPDTSKIPGITLALAREYRVPMEKIFFDRGGGGKQHADKLREQGHKVQTVAFGESVMPARKHGLTPLAQRNLADEVRYAYKNRRAQMYGILRELINPDREGPGFAIPAEYVELRRQLAPIPLRWDQEGRMMLLPKNRVGKTSIVETLTELIGCSPDEADALALAVYGMQAKRTRPRAGRAF